MNNLSQNALVTNENGHSFGSFVHPPPGWTPNMLNTQNSNDFRPNYPENHHDSQHHVAIEIPHFDENATSGNNFNQNPLFSTVVNQGSLSFNNPAMDQNLSIPIARTPNDNNSTNFINDGSDLSWFIQPTLPDRSSAVSQRSQLVQQIPIMAAHVRRETNVDHSSTPITQNRTAQIHPFDPISNSVLNTPTRQVMPRSNQFGNTYRLNQHQNIPSDSFLNFPNTSIGQQAFANYASENPRRVRTNIQSAPALSNIEEESRRQISPNADTTAYESAQNIQSPDEIILETTNAGEPNFINGHVNELQAQNRPNTTGAVPQATAPMMPPAYTPSPNTPTGVDPNILFLSNQVSSLVKALATQEGSNPQQRRNNNQGTQQIQQIDKIRTRICKTNTPPILNKGSSIIVYLRLKFDRYRKMNLFSKFEIHTALGFVFLNWSDYMSDFVTNQVKATLPDLFTPADLTKLYRLIAHKFNDNPNELTINKLQSGEHVIDFFARVLIIIEENKTHSGAFQIPGDVLNSYALQRLISKENSIMDRQDIHILTTIICQTPEIREPGKLHLCRLESMTIYEILSKFDFQRSYKDLNSFDQGFAVNAVNQQIRPTNQYQNKPPRQVTNTGTRSSQKPIVPPKNAFRNCCDLCGREHQGKCKLLQIFLKGFACDYCFKAVKPDQSFAYTLESPEVRHDGIGCTNRDSQQHPYPFQRKLQNNHNQPGNRGSFNQQNGRTNNTRNYSSHRIPPVQQIHTTNQTHTQEQNQQFYQSCAQVPIVDSGNVTIPVVEIDLESQSINSVPLEPYRMAELQKVMIPRTDIKVYKRPSDSFLNLYPIFENNMSVPVVVDTGCKPEGCIDSNLVKTLKLEKYRSNEKVRVRTADGTIVGPYNILNVPMSFGNQSVVLKFVELPSCPCGILLGLPALEHLKTNTGESARVRIEEILSEISQYSKNAHR